MSRSLGAALFAVLLAGSIGIARADTLPAPAAPIVSTALQGGADVRGEESPVPAAEPFTVTPEIRAQLEALEAVSAMPNATADLKMWSAAPAASAASDAAKPSGMLKKATDPIHRFARGIISRTSSMALSLTRSAMRFIGTPYVFGGTSPSGFDCSGYTQHVFAMLGIALPRTADAQYDAGRSTRGRMTTGDLVFFQTYEPGPSHVGIYVGDGRFVHSSSHGVMVSRLADRYWRTRYLGAKRVASFP